MIFRAVILASLVAAINSQEGCSICGDGNEVGNPDALFSFPGQPEVPCGDLEDAGENGLIPLAQCPFLVGLIVDCQCGPIVADTPAPVPAPTPAPVVAPTPAPVPAPTPAPVVAPTPAPVVDPTAAPVVAPTPAPVVAPTPAPVVAPTPAPVVAPTPAPVVAPTPAPVVAPTPAPVEAPTPATGACPDVPPTGCSICGDGLCVSNPDALFSFPGQPEVPCGNLQDAGMNGQIPLDQCPFLPGLAGVCECGEGAIAAPVPAPTAAPTAAPIPATVITPVPVTPVPVTSAPVPAPSPAPVPAVTAVPVTTAPVAPVAPPTAAPVGEGGDDDDSDGDEDGGKMGMDSLKMMMAKMSGGVPMTKIRRPDKRRVLRVKTVNRSIRGE